MSPKTFDTDSALPRLLVRLCLQCAGAVQTDFKVLVNSPSNVGSTSSSRTTLSEGSRSPAPGARQREVSLNAVFTAFPQSFSSPASEGRGVFPLGTVGFFDVLSPSVARSV